MDTPPKFQERLRENIRHFNLASALKLSMEIHHAEADGYIYTDVEDRLWSRLTNLIVIKEIK